VIHPRPSTQPNLPALTLQILIFTRAAWRHSFIGDTQASLLPHWSVVVQSAAVLKVSASTEQEKRVVQQHSFTADSTVR
jgi:hypothetical protein